MESDGFRTQERQSGGRFKPPPNYSSRGVQLKLMVLVGGLVLVFAMMNEARKPETWSFMGFDSSESESDSQDDRSIDSRRFVAQQGDTEVVQNGNQDHPGGSNSDVETQGTEDTSSDASQDNIVERVETGDLEGEELAETLLQRTRQDFWGGIYDRLDEEWRRLLYVGLREGRCKMPIPQDDRDSWNSMIDAISADRTSYENNILRAITALPLESDAKRVAWTDVLQRMQDSWSEIEVSLKAVPAGTNDEQAITLLDLQLLLDDQLLKRVKDDYLGSRRPEKEIWYRQIERMQNWDGLNSDRQPIAEPYYVSEGSVEAPQIGFVQLFEQPDAYRGRRIKIVGEVKRIEYKRASVNDYGVEGYHVLWIRPEGKSNLPMVVYSLELPEEYPDYDESGTIEFPRGDLQPIEVEAVFFKRWAYEAQDGIRLCPLLLAIEPEWRERPDRFDQLAELPSLPLAALIIAVVAVVSLGIARFAFASAGKANATGFRMPSQSERQLPDKIGDIPTTGDSES